MKDLKNQTSCCFLPEASFKQNKNKHKQRSGPGLP